MHDGNVEPQRIRKNVYTTRQELKFITDLACKGIDKLRNYKRAIPLRENWADIDKDVVVDHVNNLIGDN